jgi:AraC-like DNA-binding protein
MVEDACRVEGTDSVLLLDDPSSGSQRSNREAPAEFFETLHHPDSIVSPLLERMYWRVASNTASGAWLEDQFVAAAAALSKVHAEGCKRASKIPAKKPSTRVELYRRLLRGKDYMDSFFGDSLRLAEVANQACLSPYHFHRLFREVFRETPNQYLQRKRLANAQRLLERSEQSVTDICLEVGFESISSFSALFRRTFGCPPREYRFRKNGAR